MSVSDMVTDTANHQLVPADLLALLEVCEAAQRALCDALRSNRLSSEPVGTTEVLTQLRAVPVAGTPVHRLRASYVNGDFDPIKAFGQHPTKRNYNYFTVLSQDLREAQGTSEPA